MLSPHTPLRILLSICSFLVILASCSDSSKTDLITIKALNESIENSNQILYASCKEIMTSFEEKLKEPASEKRAKLWFPKATKIQQLSSGVFDYIESIRKDINSISSFSSILFDKLMSYKKEILIVDPKITYEFENSLNVFTSNINSSKANQRDLFENYFDIVSTTAASAMLNKLQNNIRVVEKKIIEFCYEQSSHLSFGPCIIDFPVAIINSTVVQPGERIEVTAGVGSFYSNKNTEVFVYRKPVVIKDDGIAVCRFKAKLVAGKYHVPVKINYTDQNGKQVTVQKEIEYTVANIQQQ